MTYGALASNAAGRAVTNLTEPFAWGTKYESHVDKYGELSSMSCFSLHSYMSSRLACLSIHRQLALVAIPCGTCMYQLDDRSQISVRYGLAFQVEVGSESDAGTAV